MQCYKCQKDQEPLPQDPDFASARLEGGNAVISVTEMLLCSECFEALETKAYTLKQDLSEHIAEHMGHEMALHPQTLRQVEGGYEIEYQLQCSCGMNKTMKGVAPRVV